MLLFLFLVFQGIGIRNCVENALLKQLLRYDRSIDILLSPPPITTSNTAQSLPYAYGQASSWSGSYGKPPTIGGLLPTAQASASASASAGGLTVSAGSSSSANSSSSSSTSETFHNRPYSSTNSASSTGFSTGGTQNGYIPINSGALPVYTSNNYYYNRPTHVANTGSTAGSTFQTGPTGYYTYYNPATTISGNISSGTNVSSNSIPNYYATYSKPSVLGSASSQSAGSQLVGWYYPTSSVNSQTHTGGSNSSPYYTGPASYYGSGYKPPNSGYSSGSLPATGYYASNITTNTGSHLTSPGSYYVGSSSGQLMPAGTGSNSAQYPVIGRPWWLSSSVFSNNFASSSSTTNTNQIVPLNISQEAGTIHQQTGPTQGSAESIGGESTSLPYVSSIGTSPLMSISEHPTSVSPLTTVEASENLPSTSTSGHPISPSLGTSVVEASTSSVSSLENTFSSSTNSELIHHGEHHSTASEMALDMTTESLLGTTNTVSLPFTESNSENNFTNVSVTQTHFITTGSNISDGVLMTSTIVETSTTEATSSPIPTTTLGSQTSTVKPWWISGGLFGNLFVGNSSSSSLDSSISSINSGSVSGSVITGLGASTSITGPSIGSTSENHTTIMSYNQSGFNSTDLGNIYNNISITTNSPETSTTSGSQSSSQTSSEKPWWISGALGGGLFGNVLSSSVNSSSGSASSSLSSASSSSSSESSSSSSLSSSSSSASSSSSSASSSSSSASSSSSFASSSSSSASSSSSSASSSSNSASSSSSSTSSSSSSASSSSSSVSSGSTSGSITAGSGVSPTSVSSTSDSKPWWLSNIFGNSATSPTGNMIVGSTSSGNASSLSHPNTSSGLAGTVVSSATSSSSHGTGIVSAPSGLPQLSSGGPFPWSGGHTH